MDKPDKMEFTVRVAKKKDTYKIFSLIEKQAQEERKKTEEIALTIDKIESHGFGKENYFDVLLAESKEEAIGYALYFFTYCDSLAAPILYLEDLFVDKSYRKSGLGTTLLSHLARVAIKKGCCRMEGHAFTWNKTLNTFFESHGAHPRTDLLQYRLLGEDMLKLANIK
jgi:GNAT superfamily N-acetyltransferase